MVTVYHDATPLVLPDELAQAVGLQEGARVELTVTSEGLLMRRPPLTREEKLAILDGLEGEGRRLLPHAGDQVAALLRDRAEDDRLDLEDEGA